MWAASTLLLSCVWNAQDPGSFSYAGFHSELPLRVSGAAALTGTHVRLAPALPNQAGAVWTREPIRVPDRFVTEFTYRMLRPLAKREGSDGLAFVLQTLGPDAVGGRGSAGGFRAGTGANPPVPGLPNAVAVFLDSHRNRSEGDQSGNSIGVFLNGSEAGLPKRLAVCNLTRPVLNDGTWRSVRVLYRTGDLLVSVDGRTVIAVRLDLRPLFRRTAHAGFTAATGDGVQDHEIASWSFTTDAAAIESFFQAEQVQSTIRYLERPAPNPASP